MIEARASVAAILVAGWLSPNPLLAQAPSGITTADSFVADLIALDYGACLGARALRIAHYVQAGVDDLDALVHEAEAHRLACEASRLLLEVQRLEGEQVRLLSEANRIEAEWQMAHALNAREFPDYIGRNRSQRLLVADANAISATVDQLKMASSNLQVEAVRIAELAISDFVEHSESEQALILVAIDAESQKSILDRFREALPPVGQHASVVFSVTL